MKKTIKSYSSKVLAVVMALTMLMTCMSFSASAAVLTDVLATDAIGNIDYAQYDGANANSYVMEFNPSTSGLVPMGYIQKAGFSSTIGTNMSDAKANGYDVYGMINGEFFSTQTANHGSLTGRFISNGRIISDHEGNDEYSFAIDKDGDFSFVQSHLAYHFYIEGKEVGNAAIGRVNKRYNNDMWDPICYFDDANGNKSPITSSFPGTEVLVKKINNSELMVEGVLEGEVVSVGTNTYGTAIGEGEFVLYAWNDSSYCSTLSSLTAGQKVQIYVEELNSDAVETMKNAGTVMAATYPVVRDGEKLAVKAMNSIGQLSTTERAQRTAIGVKADGTYVYFVSSGRESFGYGPGAGLTISEVGDAMLELGCVNAVNLDGGGSSTLNFGGTNKYVTENRAVGSVMMIASRNEATTSTSVKQELNNWIYNASSELNNGTYTGEQKTLVATAIQTATAAYNNANSMTGEYTRAIMELRSAMGVVPNVLPKTYLSLKAEDWSTNTSVMTAENLSDGSLKLNSLAAGWPWATYSCKVSAPADAVLFYDISASANTSIILGSGSAEYNLNSLIAPNNIDSGSGDIAANGLSFKGSIKISDLNAAGIDITSVEICSSAGAASNVTVRDFSIRTAYSAGDTDGDYAVNSNDARALLCHITNKTSLSGKALEAADANMDGAVNTADIRYILDVSVGLA